MERGPEGVLRLRVTRELLVPLGTTLPWFILGLLSFLATPLPFIAARDAWTEGMYRHPAIIAGFHLLVLGWGTSIGLGALQQLIPVLFVREGKGRRAGFWGFILYGPGLLLLVLGLLRMPSLIPYGATLVPAGVVVVVLALLLDIGKGRDHATRQGQRVRPFVVSALLYLVGTVLAGAALATNWSTGWLGEAAPLVFPLHINFAVSGWFTLLVIGVSYHMLPFFGLTEKRLKPRWDRWVLGLLHGSVVCGAAGSVALRVAPGVQPFFIFAILLYTGAVALFLWEHRSLFGRRDGRRRPPTLGYIRAAHISLTLFVASVVGAALFGERFPVAAYLTLGVFGALGWLSLSILGYLHQILPFILWHSKYWGRTSEPGVPTFRDMIPPRAAWRGFAAYGVGVALLAIGPLFGVPLALAGTVWWLGALFPTGILMRAVWK